MMRATLVIMMLAVPGLGYAQGFGAPPAWSPAAWTTDLPRTLPLGPTLPVILTAPAPRVGLHWSAGNPAGLPFESGDEWAGFNTAYGRESGAYHRPLEAGRISTASLFGGGWRRIGAGAVSGGLTVGRSGFGDGMYGNLVTPYSSSPHTSADTSGADIRELRARLEGAGGWRIGGWSLGLSLAYETTDARTQTSLTPRFRRTGAGAATAGIAHAFLDGGIIVGLYGRAMSDAQRLVVSAPRGVSARVYMIEGLNEPVAIDFVNGAYDRRVQRDGYGFGASASLRGLDTRWVLWGGYSRMTEAQVAEVRRGAPEDRFEPAGVHAGLAAQRGFADERGQLTLNLAFRTLEGDATRAALVDEGVLFQVDEQVAGGSLDIRWRSAVWQAAILGGLQHESRIRRDVLARSSSDLSAWRPHGAIEAARSFGPLSLGLGLGVSSFGPSGAIDRMDSRGPGFQRLIAPELMLYAAAAMGYAGALSARWQTDSGRRLWARVGYETVSPRDDAVTRPFEPGGSRSRLNVGLGITLHSAAGVVRP